MRAVIEAALNIRLHALRKPKPGKVKPDAKSGAIFAFKTPYFATASILSF